VVGADLRKDIIKTRVLKEVELCAQNKLSILGSIVNITGGPMAPSYGSLLVDFENSRVAPKPSEFRTGFFRNMCRCT
jgi:hypothetical protein